MKKPKIATAEQSAPKVKPGQVVAAVVTEAKTKKPDSAQKPLNKPKAITPKPAAKAKAEQPIATVFTEEKPKKTAAKKSTNKPKPVNPQPVLEAKSEQPVAPIAAEAKPKKTRAPQNSPKKAKAVDPKTKTTATEIANPGHVNLPPGNIWPNCVENLLRSFGGMKK
jgi:hypothetical protein